MTGKIEDAVQKHLDGILDFQTVEYEVYCKTSLERYKLRCAERLCKYVKKFRLGQIGIKDVLVSLRTYLLTYQADVNLPGDIDISGNAFGLKIDGYGKCYAAMRLPDYLDEKIVEQAFMRGELLKNKQGDEFLGVSPNIFRITGFRYYKSLSQKIAVTGALNMPDGYTALISLPTGGGKSLITQAMAFQKESGLTIVVVPTVSLAMDQERVGRENIKVANPEEIYCYYGDPQCDKNAIYNGLINRTLRLLFISPEALIKNEYLRKLIDDANKTGYLKNIIIDEAHIVIEWGNFFRVDYQCLEPWRNALFHDNDKLRTVLLSATFEKTTVNMLKEMFSVSEKWLEIRCDALRKEPRFNLIKAKSYSDKKRKLTELLNVLPRPMIVYVTSPDQAESIKKLAIENGFQNVVTFTGATKGGARKKIIEEWSNNEYDLIVATSAFGVGVDKPDVRTVLHMYVPENANKYYQELGRGGRDGLPSLSIMCVYPQEDLDSAFYLTTKVLSAKKIVGRWNSMLNSPSSKRYLDTYALDTSVKPNYSDADYAEDANSADIKWNIYVILLLRRKGLIKILEMLVEPGSEKYVIRVRINNDLLLKNNSAMEVLISQIRDEEWKKTEADFRVMSNAVYAGDNKCWSEMFYDIYSLVSAYCGGCGNHQYVIEEEKNRFKLLKRISEPTQAITPEINRLFGTAKEAILLTDLYNYDLIAKVINKGFQVIVIDDTCTSEYIDLLLNMNSKSDINFMGITEYTKMLQMQDYYYVSGAAIVIYGRNMANVYKKLSRIRNLSLGSSVKVLHIFEKNLFFSETGKDAVSLIDGPVLEEIDMERS